MYRLIPKPLKLKPQIVLSQKEGDPNIPNSLLWGMLETQMGHDCTMGASGSESDPA